jgi:hypothetical protein
MEKICIKESTTIRNDINVNNIFDTGFNEIKLNNNLLCGYYLLSYILSTFNNQKYNIQEIKQQLINAYQQILKLDNKVDYKLRILNILAKQLKKEYVLKIKKNQLTIESMILNDTYYISQFDIWLLCYINEYPVFMYSNNIYSSMQLKHNYVVTSGNLETDKFMCIYFDNVTVNDSFESSISIIEPFIEGKKILMNDMKKLDLKDHLRNYKMHVIIKK